LLHPGSKKMGRLEQLVRQVLVEARCSCRESYVHLM
jgi:hypothetical protein